MKIDDKGLPVGTPIHTGVCPKCKRLIGSLTVRRVWCCGGWVQVGHAAALTNSSAVTLPFDALMILAIKSRVMFCVPLRMREMDASVTPTLAANSLAVTSPLVRY